MKNLIGLPEIFDYDKAKISIRDGFDISISSFRQILTLLLKHEYGVPISESVKYWAEDFRKNTAGNTEIALQTSDTPGSKMLNCEISNSGQIHFSLYSLNDRGENAIPRLAWETVLEEPLNQRFDSKDYWKSSEEFSGYLPKIAEFLKK
jgi:hypothetical protein